MLKLKDSMRPQDHKLVFYKINELYKIHTEFNNELSNPSVKLGATFIKWREKFLIYGAYCANLSKARNTLQELCDTDEQFLNYVQLLEKKSNNGKFKLTDILSVPMQRILKYHLLLENLIENTDVNHEEYNDLRRAREAMVDVAGYINEEARDHEHLDVIANLQESIEWSPDKKVNLVDYGRLIKDGEIKFIAHDDQKTKNRYVFIFDKCILICKQSKGQQFAYRGLINIADFHIDEAQNRTILNKEARWSFHLVKNPNTVYTFTVRSIELKEQMIKAINDALDNIHPANIEQHTSHHFELQTFTKPEQCHHCSKYLKGLIFQGYRCSTCQIAAHKSCLIYTGKCGRPPNHSPTSPPPLPPPPYSFATNNEHSSLRNKLWFVGEMDRDNAQRLLEHRENGTYLVRIRLRCDQADKYALSLKTEDTVKHMKICSKVDASERKYYLSLSKFFNNIEELVNNYQNHSLKENFEGLEENTKLLWPFKQVQVVAIRNFIPQEFEQVPLREGMRIILLAKEGYRDGWWKGKTDSNEIGFFPCNCVVEDLGA